MTFSRLLVRAAAGTGAEALAGFCDELGYPSPIAEVCARLCLFDDPERTLLVAEASDDLAGLVGVHDYYLAVGRRRVKDQRLYEHPL
jgi:hypothetical protein